MFRRKLRQLKPALAMIGLAGFALGSNSFGNSAVSGQSSAGAVQIRMADDSSTDGPDGSLVFRSARRPIILPISFKIADGGPQIQPDALEVVLEALRDHPRRLVTIEVEGLPISFKGLPRSTRGKLLERGGPEFPERYDGFVVRELTTLLDGVRGARPNSPVAIAGLPFDGDGRNESLLNERFEPVISRLSAFVLDRGVVVSSRSDEQAMVLRSFPNAISLADGRAVIYPLNLGWRLAIEGESLAANEVDEDAKPQTPDREQFTDTRSAALGDAGPLMSDLEDLGVAGRGSGKPVTTRSSAGGDTASDSGGASVPDIGGSGASGGVAGPAGGGRGNAALPFARNEEVDIDPPTNAASEEDPPADDAEDEDAGEEDPPADDAEDEDAGEEDPPADDAEDEDAGEEDPPADDAEDEDAGEEDPPADDAEDEDAGEEDPPVDDAEDEDAGEEDPPVDDAEDEDAGEEDPPADDAEDEDAGEEDPPVDDAEDEDAGEEDPPADDAEDEDAGEEDPPVDDAEDEDAGEEDDWNPGDEVEDPPAGDDGDGDEGDAEDGESTDDSAGGDSNEPPADDPGYVISNPEIPIGVGFDGATEIPASFGPDDETRDRLPVARWNVVPFQRFDGPVSVGVVAFHINGIDRVEFSANGGAWVSAQGMSLNPRTGVREFWGVLDPSATSGAVELRALIWPRDSGTPLVLQSSVDHAGDRFGMSSMFFADNDEEIQTIWVSESGSDSAPGNEDMPLASLSAAANRLRTVGAASSGRVVIASSGVFEAPANVGIYSMDSWMTISAAEGIEAASIVIVPSGYKSSGDRMPLRPSIAKLHWRGVSFDFDTTSVYYTEDPSDTRPESYLWFEDCRWYDDAGWEMRRPGQSYNVRSGGNRGLYMTDCHLRDLLYGPCGFSLVRNTLIEKISGDSLSNVQCVLNTKVDRHHLVIPDFHCDVLQYWGDTRNIVVFGLDASDLVDVQDMLFDRINSSFQNIAVVDAVFQNFANALVVKTQFNSRCENFLMSHVTILDQAVVFRDDFEGSSQFVADGVDFVNSVFETMQSGNYYSSELPPGLRIDHCHIAQPTDLFGAGSEGTNEIDFGAIDIDFDGVEWRYSGEAVGELMETGLYVPEFHLEIQNPDRGFLPVAPTGL